jgi:hypothetical protein
LSGNEGLEKTLVEQNTKARQQDSQNLQLRFLTKEIERCTQKESPYKKDE